ncbi:TPA: restriction endonuclease subunit S [Streptococcus suis]|nr:restriction endonuclease subunit S [Streptococcus suis]HEM3658951.1 restriction endonuclease subunit S [Streptococcus suis]
MPNKDKNIPKRRFKAFENADAWELRKLGEYSTLITKGTTPRDKSGIGVVNFVKVENLVNGDIIPLQKIQLEEHEGYLKRSQLIENDILFSIAGTLGRTAIVKKSILPANTNQALSIIRGYEFDRNFLVTILRGVVVREFIKRNPTIGAQPNLSLEQVSNLCLLTPCSEEQSAIGTFFSTLDQHITLHQRKLDKLKSVKQAYLSEMFPAEGERVPKRRFPGFTDDWELRNVGEICRISTGKSNTQDREEQGKFPFYVRSPIIEKSTKYLFDEEAVLTVGDGVGTGKVFHYVHGKYDLHQRVYRMFSFTHVNAKYFYYYFSKKFFDRVMAMTAKNSVDSVRLEMISDMEITIPQLEEQEKIVKILSTLDQQITLHQRKLEKLKNLKKALLNELFV